MIDIDVDIAVITSCYGNHDQLVTPPAQDIEVDWIAVVDDPEVVPDGWRAVVEPRPNLHRRTAAKVAKCLPWLYTRGAETSIWLDANVRLKGSGAIRQLLDWAGEAPLAQFPHPDRKCAVREAEFSASLPKYAHQPIAEQIASYVAKGLPRDWGLWATGVIVRQFDEDLDGLLVRHGERWLLEQVRWTDQDQVSETAVLHRIGLRPGDLDGWLWDNAALTFAPHVLHV